MAFNFLNRLRNQFAQEEVIDQDNPVDEEEGDIDDESDVEFAQGGEEEEEESADNVDLDLASESDPKPNDPFPWSTTLHDVEVELFTRRKGANLDLFDLDYSANPIDFFNLCNCFAQFHENMFNS